MIIVNYAKQFNSNWLKRAHPSDSSLSLSVIPSAQQLEIFNYFAFRALRKIGYFIILLRHSAFHSTIEGQNISKNYHFDNKCHQTNFKSCEILKTRPNSSACIRPERVFAGIWRLPWRSRGFTVDSFCYIANNKDS